MTLHFKLFTFSNNLSIFLQNAKINEKLVLLRNQNNNTYAWIIWRKNTLVKKKYHWATCFLLRSKWWLLRTTNPIICSINYCYLLEKKSKDTKYLQVPVVLNVVVTTQENGWSEPMGTTTPYKPIWRNVTSSLSPERAKPCVVGIGIFWHSTMVLFILKKKE